MEDAEARSNTLVGTLHDESYKHTKSVVEEYHAAKNECDAFGQRIKECVPNDTVNHLRSEIEHQNQENRDSEGYLENKAS